MNLSGKTIVLTGASGGIGRELAHALNGQGARLLLVARSADKLELLRDELGGEPHRVVATDLATQDGRRCLFDACTELGSGNLHMLINNAGINAFELFESQSTDAIEALLAINLLSPMLVCHMLLPLLRECDQARIVNVGSTFGSIGYPGFSSYCASKFGLRGFTEALRRELADSSVSVSYVAPRATRTSLNSANVVAMNATLGTAMDDPGQVASQVLKVVRGKGGKDKYIGWPEKLFVRVNALLPGLVDANLRKQLPVIRHFAKSEI